MTWLPLHCAFHLCWLQCVCFPDQDLVLKVAKALNDRRKSSYCFIVVRQGCNIQFHLSTQLTHSRPRYLLRHFFFLIVSLRVVLDEISIWVCTLRKADGSPMWLGIRQSLENLNEQKVEEERICLLTDQWDLNTHFLWPWVLLVFRTSDPDWGGCY